MQHFELTVRKFNPKTESIMQIFFNLNKEVTQVYMTYPSILDYLRDMGGLLCLLYLIGSGLTRILNYNKQSNALIGKLY